MQLKSRHGSWTVHWDTEGAFLHCKCGWSAEVLPMGGVTELGQALIEPLIERHLEQVEQDAVCEYCGTWECYRCGWRRYRANRAFGGHECPKCGGAAGIWLDVRHRDPYRCWPDYRWEELRR